MKYSKYCLFLIVIIFAFSACKEPQLEDGDYNLEIYATNDIHGRYFDSLYVPSSIGARVNPYSLASIASVVEQAREHHGADNVVLIDVGDNLQGDNATFYYNFVDTISPHIFPLIANYLKYDAAVVGNHDIETGHKVYDRVTSQLRMPYLASNAINENTQTPYFEPYTIINRHGIKLAVIGLTNPNVPSWLAADLWSGMYFQDIVSSLNYWVKYVKEKEAPHVMIAAMHGGLGLEDVDDLENPARYVAKHVKGIDLVLASHDHRVVAEKHFNGEKDVWLLEGGSRASNLSKAIISISILNGEVSGLSIEGENIDIESVGPSNEYMTHFRGEFLKVKEFTNRKIGFLQDNIDSRDSYFGPSAYVDMIHSLQLRVSGADISLAAPLSFNKQILKGDLNYQNLMDLYPFENQLNVVEMSGTEIKNYLEYSYSLWLNQAPIKNQHLLSMTDGAGEHFRLKNPHYNFDSAAGIIYEVDITKPVNSRIKIISMANGEPFKLSNKYSVAVTSYRASGGGDLMTNGALIPKSELQSRILARYADIRGLLFAQLQENGSFRAEKLNQWKFVPEDIAASLGHKDYQAMFGN